MTEGTPDGPIRLRGAGVGSVFGGVGLGILSVPLSFAPAAAVVLLVGVLSFLIARRRGGGTQTAIGVVAVGAIGLVEAAPWIGLGLDALFLAAIAVVFGIADVLVGAILRRITSDTA